MCTGNRLASMGNLNRQCGCSVFEFQVQPALTINPREGEIELHNTELQLMSRVTTLITMYVGGDEWWRPVVALNAVNVNKSQTNRWIKIKSHFTSNLDTLVIKMLSQLSLPETRFLKHFLMCRKNMMIHFSFYRALLSDAEWGTHSATRHFSSSFLVIRAHTRIPSGKRQASAPKVV